MTATSFSLLNTDRFTVQYRVENLSKKAHTWALSPLPGVSVLEGESYCSRAFLLEPQHSCLLTLRIDGALLKGDLHRGPVLCQQNENGEISAFLCYQPSQVDSLNVRLQTVPPAETLYAGLENGDVYAMAPNQRWMNLRQSANDDAVNSLFATNTALYLGSADGHVYYSTNNGESWVVTSPLDGSAVHAVFIEDGILYAGTQNGNLYSSLDNGGTWLVMHPGVGSILSFFALNQDYYIGSSDGQVYYSHDAGSTWQAINGAPDGSGIHGVFVANQTLYALTAHQYVYSSTALSGGGVWTPYAQTVYSLFMNTLASQVLAGTESGYVFSITNGLSLGLVTSSAVNSLFLLNG